MKTTKVWCFVFAAVVLATCTTALSKHFSDLEESRPAVWKRAQRTSPEKRWLMASTRRFFAGNKRPVGLPDISRGEEVQQKLPRDPPGTKPYFVSLFDPLTNTPFYSAYKVTPDHAKDIGKFSQQQFKWRDPQDVPGLHKAYKKAMEKEPLSRGHLNPSAINSFNKNYMEATFTLTNAVPHFKASNSGPWQDFETKIRNYAQNTCGKKGGILYLLTGISENGLKNPRGKAVPKPNVKDMFLGGKVQLITPRAVWTAGCCEWKEPGKWFGRFWKTTKAESFAVMSNNHKDETKLYQTQMSVHDLERLLRAPSSTVDVNLFPGNQNCRRAQNNIALK